MGNHSASGTNETVRADCSAYCTDEKEFSAAQPEAALPDVYRLALGGTAVGTGINAAPGFAEAAAAEIARQSGLPFVSAPNKFTVQGAHDALVHLSSTFRTLAVSLVDAAKMIRPYVGRD
jgi:fumarate hydratase class II